MNLIKYLFKKEKNNEVSWEDIKNITALIVHLHGVVDFMKSKNELPKELISKFNSNKDEMSRILKSKRVATYFKRYLSTSELVALVNIMKMTPEILDIGSEKENFLSGKFQQEHIRYLIQKITLNNTRWLLINE